MRAVRDGGEEKEVKEEEDEKQIFEKWKVQITKEK